MHLIRSVVARGPYLAEQSGERNLGLGRSRPSQFYQPSTQHRILPLALTAPSPPPRALTHRGQYTWLRRTQSLEMEGWTLGR